MRGFMLSNLVSDVEDFQSDVLTLQSMGLL
jgi:hypothetical protein